MSDELYTAFSDMLAARCTPDVVRLIDSGDSISANTLWQDLEDSGFLDALVPEHFGGAGLSLRDVLGLVQACGHHALPLPFAETMAARAVCALVGQDAPIGPSSLNAVSHWLPADTLRSLKATLNTGLIAGAGTRVLQLSLDHAQQRVQFGKPIGSFQAVQHQLAVMAEQASSARMAAQLAFSSSTHLPQPLLAAMAMTVAGEASTTLVAGSHAVHGAIGITAEYELQLYTRRLLSLRTAVGSPAYWSQQVASYWLQAGGCDTVDFALHAFEQATT